MQKKEREKHTKKRRLLYYIKEENYLERERGDSVIIKRGILFHLERLFRE